MALDPKALDEPDGTVTLTVKGEQIVLEYRIVDGFRKPDVMRAAPEFWEMVRAQDDEEAVEQAEMGEEEFQPLIDFVHDRVCGVASGLTCDWSDLTEQRQRQILRRDSTGLVRAYIQIMADDGLEEDEKKS